MARINNSGSKVSLERRKIYAERAMKTEMPARGLKKGESERWECDDDVVDDRGPCGARPKWGARGDARRGFGPLLSIAILCPWL
jgi:hypothetical protein